MIQCGLLGEKLPHSYSPQIHAMLGHYAYTLFEKTEDALASFLRDGEWDGINVTIPYKKKVLPYLSELSPTAEMIGSVNTIIRRADNTLFGDNTDVYGFMMMVVHSKISVENKKTLVLGSGGASASVLAALREMHAKPVVISRTGENNYQNLYLHKDAEIIVNTTPVGMYPHTGVSPLDLTGFSHLTGVLDLIYNPDRTALLLQAEELGIPCENGLYMLVAQAKRSAELFLGKNLPDGEIDRIYQALKEEKK